MAHAKRYLFEPTEQEFADGCKALGHPARRRIVDLLRKHDHLSLEKICDEIPLSRTAVYEHIRLIKSIGLIIIGSDVTGKSGYKIDEKVMIRMKKIMSEYWEQV